MFMKFDNALDAFHHLFTLDEHKMLENLDSVVEKEDAIYQEVRQLINAHHSSDDGNAIEELISTQASELVENDIVLNLVGKQVGVYQLKSMIGHGGMGAVYLGERNDGQLQQKVAIKFVFPALAAIAGDGFLQKEAQHLADLEHPNITKILTVGRTDDDLPYMVMEYIDGKSIDKYCEQHNLTLTQRLLLFKKVCSAVQVAHQNMVIHADIKPSNILVDQQGEPKLMDFGIAQNINNAIDESSLSNEEKKSYARALSREYASPEQLAGKTLTTVSDVYSIGNTINSVLKNDDREVMSLIKKASQFESLERYQSVGELLEDIENYLSIRPLKAHQSAFYVTRKFLVRNMVGSILGGALAAASAFFYVQTLYHNQQLEQEKLVSDKISDFLIESFNAADPSVATKEHFLAIDVLKLAEKNLAGVENLPENTKGKVMLSFASAYAKAGKFDEALNILREISDYEGQNINRIHLEISGALMNMSKYEEAIEYAQKVVDSVSANKEEFALARAQLGALYMFLDKNEEALVELKAALPLLEEAYGGLHRNIPAVHNQIAQIYTNKGDYNKVIEYSNLAYETSRDYFGEASPQMSNAILSLAHVYSLKEDFEKNAEMIERALEIDKKVYGEDHARIIIISNNLGNAYSKLGWFDKAIDIHKEALALTIKKFGKKHIDYAYSNAYLANALGEVEQFDSSVDAYTEAYNAFNELFGEKHQVTIMAKSNLAEGYLLQGNIEQAESMLLEALETATTEFGEGHPRLAMVQANYAKLLIAMDKRSDALEVAKTALATFRNHFPEDGQRVQGVLSLISSI